MQLLSDRFPELSHPRIEVYSDTELTEVFLISRDGLARIASLGYVILNDRGTIATDDYGSKAFSFHWIRGSYTDLDGSVERHTLEEWVGAVVSEAHSLMSHERSPA